MNAIFFGSTSDSVLVLDKLIHFPFSDFCLQFSAVVTQPPSPVGRKQTITATPVETWASDHHIPVVSFPTDANKPWLYKREEDVIHSLSTFKSDLLISASYGQKIPSDLIHMCPMGGINIHPSLLPRWRGAYPVPWTILSGDSQTGVTLITLADKFDQGLILSQQKIPVTKNDVAETLRKKLFSIGADLLIQTLPAYLSKNLKGHKQLPENATVAKRMNRQDGCIPWGLITYAMDGKDVKPQERSGILTSVLCPLSSAIMRMLRALSPWPGVWSLLKINNEEKRLKILEAHVENEKLILDTVQLEGKKPVNWLEFEKAYL
jgi:methionyl-tRNA formyltransferase